MMKRKIAINASRYFLVGLVIFLSGCGRTLPTEKTIEVPFTSQAPAGDWSEPWQNACEEASIYMISSFYAGDEIKQAEAIQRIHEIFVAKAENFTVSKDESLQTITELIDTLDLPIDTHIVYDPTIDQLKTELSLGNPIIVPVYAPQLSSVYSVAGGADYHVIVLVGYNDTDEMFLINDPGTAGGEGVLIPYDTFMNAIHDLDVNDYLAGKKAVLFTQRETEFDWFK
ncbi:MAG TPA: C39 family peptidase [Patescibacteria group bacterium]|nr:C39 family peptidase [Patescibacteria group bacterium]